jgi:hypothetical protein
MSSRWNLPALDVSRKDRVGLRLGGRRSQQTARTEEADLGISTNIWGNRASMRMGLQRLLDCAAGGAKSLFHSLTFDRGFERYGLLRQLRNAVHE